jgi:cytochrome P450
MTMPASTLIPRLSEPPLIGSLLSFKKDRIGLLVRTARECGDIGTFRLGPQEVVLVNSPRLLAPVMIDNAQDFDGGQWVDKLGLLLGSYSLLLLLGDEHMKQRKLVAPLFQPRRVAEYVKPMVALTDELQRSWQDGSEVDLSLEMSRLTMRIIGKTLLDLELFSHTDELGAAMKESFNYIEYLNSSLMPLPMSWPTPRNTRVRQSLATIRARLQQLIDQRRTEHVERGDFLSMLLHTRDENGQGMSDAQLRDHVVTIFVGGHDTTTSALAWSWYLLMKHPDVYARLRQEVDEVLGSRPATWEDLPRLGYTLQVVKEVLRLYPPGYIIGRRSLKDVSVGDYVIPKGRVVLISPYTLHRNAEVFPNPERFEPERFEPARETQLPRHSWLPFGAGPHTCIGSHFALMEAQLVIATLVQRVTFELPPGQQVTEHLSASLKPSHCVGRVRRRG